ncbi:hypothetical protein CRUP_001650 [Coryphaenoides rupestris]|nr:hypothetical protein CRUP_001650 [Coryphaenoides rupestris]
MLREGYADNGQLARTPGTAGARLAANGTYWYWEIGLFHGGYAAYRYAQPAAAAAAAAYSDSK